MRLSRTTAALLALPTATLAVTLSDFTPRVSNLPATCQSVYTQTIDGCQASDFQGTCSKTCVLALNALTSQVQSACANEGITGSNIIMAFLGGQGPSSLCDDAAQYLSSTSASQAATTSASSTSTSASSVTSTTTVVATTSTTSSAILTETVTAASSTAPSSSSAILTDTSHTATGTSSATRSSQTDMTDSGGGSPFDTEGNTASGATGHSTLSLATTLFTTILAFAFTLR